MKLHSVILAFAMSMERNKKDLAEAAVWYDESAEHGYARAQFKIGLFYDKGYGVAQNKEEAAKWYRKAADQGDADAQCNLGYCYKTGDGVTKTLSGQWSCTVRLQIREMQVRRTIWAIAIKWRRRGKEQRESS